MPDVTQRDPEETAAALAGWLASRLPEGASPSILEVEAPESNGFSNETILCRAAWQADGEAAERRLVVRVHPTRHLLFLDADFSVQYRVMKALHDAGAGVPLPNLRWYEEDPQWLGVPFFVMDFVDGLVPSDNMPYTMEGWVVNATVEQQSRMWWQGIEALASVHRVDVKGAGLAWLAETPHGKDGLGSQLTYYRHFLDWTARGRHQPVAEAAWQWLLKHRPATESKPVLCWGDSRLGNIIWDDFTPRAVLDWEMATVGPPELDLGWWLYFDRQFTEGLGVSRPPGFGGHEETVERYVELLGRPVQDLFYYQVFSGFRFAIVMARLTDLLVGSGVLPADTDMGTNNLATQFVAQLLDLPAPGA